MATRGTVLKDRDVIESGPIEDIEGKEQVTTTIEATGASLVKLYRYEEGRGWSEEYHAAHAAEMMMDGNKNIRLRLPEGASVAEFQFVVCPVCGKKVRDDVPVGVDVAGWDTEGENFVDLSLNNITGSKRRLTTRLLNHVKGIPPDVKGCHADRLDIIDQLERQLKELRIG